MPSLRERSAAALQIEEERQSSAAPDADNTALSAQHPSKRPQHGSTWQPDPTLLGKEQAHQWLLPWVFGALFVIGVVTAARGWQQVEHAAVSASWPYTRGVIVSSEVESYSSSEGVRWRPVVRYLYRVGKREVFGARVSLVDPLSGFDEADARAFAERYRLHGDVLVFYNPERVTESVLDQSAPRSAYITINLGLALATASAASLMLSLRSSRRALRPHRAVAQSN